MRAELTELDNADEHLEALAAREQELRARLSEHAKVLSDARRGASAELARAIEGELRALHLADARLEVRVEELAEPGPRGADQVEFLFTANRGEAAAPLTKVASGGELSRVLLAFKGVLATGDHITTYVFDEVDAGVGGAVAEAIGRRLYAASRGRQVLCITHLPQIAAFADAHFRVDKVALEGRTVTRVERLDDDARVEELARMLGGARVTASARDHAVQLIAEATRAPGDDGAKGPRAKTKTSATPPAKAKATTKTASTTATPTASVKRAAKPALGAEVKGGAGTQAKTGAKAKTGSKAKATSKAKTTGERPAKATKSGRGRRARAED